MGSKLSVKALGPLEQEIIQILWHEGACTVREVHQQIGTKAYTTILTTMDRLAEKGVLVRHRDTDVRWHAFVYAPAVPRRELLTLAVSRILDDLGADADDRRHVAAAIIG